MCQLISVPCFFPRPQWTSVFTLNRRPNHARGTHASYIKVEADQAVIGQRGPSAAVDSRQESVRQCFSILSQNRKVSDDIDCWWPTPSPSPSRLMVKVLLAPTLIVTDTITTHTPPLILVTLSPIRFTTRTHTP